MGAESVVVFILELHQRTTELHKVVIDPVNHLVAGEDRAVLHHPHVPVGIDNSGIHVPQGRVADEVGIIVKERCLYRLAVIDPVFFDELEGFGFDEAHQTVPLPVPVLGREARTHQDGEA